MTDQPRRELLRALYCCSEVLNTRRLRAAPIPRWLKDYHDDLQADWSAHGHTARPAADEHPTIGAEEAAMLLNVTPRHARRIARRNPSLGRPISGVWVFDRPAVENYASRKKPT